MVPTVCATFSVNSQRAMMGNCISRSSAIMGTTRSEEKTGRTP